MILIRLPALLPLVFLPVLAGEFREDRLRAIDDAIGQAVTDARAPGAVFRMERENRIYQKAYGWKSVVPAREPMTEDTIFDAASLTKVVATTCAIMKLMEAGKIDLDAPASRYLPEFTGHGKQGITLRHLLTHSSGLKAGLSPDGDWNGKAAALLQACNEKPVNEPGTAYRYSDINFIVLGFVVERVAGTGLDDYCAKEIFAPLGMRDTGFRPAADARIAPTEIDPSPPDAATAAAIAGEDTPAIGAWTIGTRIPSMASSGEDTGRSYSDALKATAAVLQRTTWGAGRRRGGTQVASAQGRRIRFRRLPRPSCCGSVRS